MADRVGQQLGNYRLLHLIGRGSIADVYLGEHLHLNTQVAIKVLHTYVTSENSEQIRTEARMVARLVYPHIVRVLDLVIEDGIPFLVMEYAPNGNLRERHPKGTRVPLDAVVSYARQVAEALHYIHQQKLIHRNIKPENMVLGRNNEVLLSDFGVAIIVQSTRSQPTIEAAGTVTYMAPEQLTGKPRPASDQYALGAVVYEWLSGEPPFSGSIREIANQHLSAPPPPLHTRIPAISPAIEQVVLKALAKDPEQRFEHVQAFALALEEAFHAESPRRTPFAPSSEPSTGSGQERPSPRSLPTGTVTLLFTDIEGSTRLLQQLGDRYASVLGEWRHLLRATFQEWNGHEVDTQGDSFFVAFARATDAALAVVEAQRALTAHPWPEGVVVRVRMGLHTGEPALTPEGYVGLDMHRAARIMSAAHGGQVLLSQTTANLVEQDLPDDLSLRDLGEHRLKDLGRPRRLFQLVISDLPADFPPLRTLGTYPNNLPMQYTPFIGREQELAAVQQLLLRGDVRLVTLTGPGGTGKTRLGLQVAAELSDSFAGGVFFVNLAPINDPVLVVPTIAETIGIREGAGQSLLERLKEDLRPKQMLLLLDNFEQVVSAAAQVLDLLTACPRLKVLVTSREVLHVQAEHEFLVPPLPLPDPKRLPDIATLSHNAAVALFIQRAQMVKPDFLLTNANARAIVEICARLDGLPLAIELAAARMKLLPPQALLARLGQSLQVLTGAARNLPARQQTLRNTIAWSYNLLDAQEEQLFRRLSIFTGGCTIEAAEAVCAAPGEGNEADQVLDVVASLVDKSLLQQTGQEGEEPRLMMLETIREYGLEALAASGETETMRQAHAAYYLRFAEEAEPELDGPRQAVWLERLEQEHDNLRAALQWLVEHRAIETSREMALRLGGALRRFWRIRGHWSDGRDFLERALVGSKGVAVPVQVKALKAAAHLAFIQSDNHRAEALYEECLAKCREVGDTAGMALSLRRLGAIAARRGNLVGASSLTEESLALFRGVGDRAGIAYALNNLAASIGDQGEYARAILLLEESLALFREVGDKEAIAWVLIHLAYMLFLSQGDPAKVHSLLEEGLALCRELGSQEDTAWALGHLGEVVLKKGDAVKARSLLEESVALSGEIGYWYGTAKLLSLLGRVEALERDYAAARTLYEESLAIARVMGDRLNTPFYLEGLADVVATQGDPVWAARLWGVAEALREEIRALMPPIYRADYERSVAAARTQLGEKSFAAAWAEGRSMTPEQALAAQGSVMMPVSPPESPPISPTKSPPTYPGGLTAREVEVLRLLAQGLTDAQIAERLVIAPRTVNNHLTSIYSKIQVSSRSAATRYAMERQLV
jgi:predicted ATPase/serine/threonine protein kinase/DNA-binding CsgD family transcriptional regulator